MIPPLLVVSHPYASPVRRERFLSVVGLRVLFLARRDRAVRDRSTARTHQATQDRIRSQIQTLLFHLPFSVLVESLKQVFDRRAFLDYGFQLRDRHVQLIFFDNPVR